MKNFSLLILLIVNSAFFLYAQQSTPTDAQQKAITTLIDQYSEAREKSDTLLLKKILTADVDQLVSTGEWRNGISAAVQGMIKSSANSPGTRTLTIEKIKMFNTTTAIVDCRYEITNTDGTIRKMWSSFLVIAEKKKWKISSIRNMMPAGS
jgi:ketosteroid isomerase-like protein